jgi:phage baseplate assembly protein W
MAGVSDIAGPGYPFAIDPATGSVAWASGRAKLTQNLRLIIGTRLGERPMLRNFGTPLHSLIHEPNDETLARLIVKQVRDALIQAEPRIVVTALQVAQRGGELVLEIHYIPSDRPQPETLYLPLE